MSTETNPQTPDEELVDAAFEAFYNGGDPGAPIEVRQLDDDLAKELRGDDPPAAPSDDSPTGDDSQGAPESGNPDDALLTKLQRATRDKAVADERLHETRTKAEMLEAENAELRRLLTRPQEPAQPAPQSAPNAAPAPLTDQEVDAFMVDFDPDWERNREDPEARRAARYAISLTRAAVKHVAGQFGPVAQSVESIRFDGKLGQLGISRAEFNAIWERPGREYGQVLSDDQKLQALSAEAARMPDRPVPVAPSARQPAPPASKVDPRTHVELDQGGSAAHGNPQTLSTMKLQKAMASGDVMAMDAAADPLFEAFYNGMA